MKSASNNAPRAQPDRGARMSSPYENLPARAFWRSTVGRTDADALAQLYSPKVELTRQTPLMTVGSCFARHIHQALTRDGWNVLQGEDMRAHMPEKLCHRYGYNLFSARYGNIYTARQFRQLVAHALDGETAPTPVWQRDGRYFDALRPTVEPEGLDHPDDVRHARLEHLRAVKRVLQDAESIVLTLGLTECWMDVATGLALPTAPGHIAGDYDPAKVRFHNFTQSEVLADLRATRDLLRKAGIKARFVLTVSPVPLVATASGNHVGPASTYSKSVLRAACGELQAGDADFDYFPAFEIVSTPIAGGPYIEQDGQQPSQQGIKTAVTCFALSHGEKGLSLKAENDVQQMPPRHDPTDAQCEQILLEAYHK